MIALCVCLLASRSFQVRTHAGLEDGALLSLYISPPPTTVSSEESRGWNTTVFVDVLRELYPRLNWLSVFKHLDQPMFVVPDSRAFTLLISVMRRGHREPLPKLMREYRGAMP